MNAKDCPFCGMECNLDNDTLYPNGVGWEIAEGGYRHYVSRNSVPPEQWCYKVICNESYGGCGVEMSGDSREEVVEKWNKRV